MWLDDRPRFSSRLNFLSYSANADAQGPVPPCAAFVALARSHCGGRSLVMNHLNPILPVSLPPAVSVPKGVSCPRCQAALTDPDGLGLCAACGYCRAREDARSRASSDSGSHSRLGV